ncbi:MAG: SUF system Fe-S cluster assembly protein [Sphingomonadales bacterium]
MSEDANNSPERPMVGNQHRYLDEFLNEGEKVAEPATTAPEEETLDDRILAALRSIYDPEIPVNIYDLGLIYDCNIDADNNVEVIMTLTTPHCPVAETMPGEVEMRVAGVPGVQSAEVRVVWDPPWDPSKMTEEAKLELGFL